MAWYDTIITNIKNSIEAVYLKKSSIVTSWSGTVSNDNIPSGKLVKDSLDGKSGTGHGHSGTYVDGVTGKNTTNGSALAEIKANTTVKGTVYHPKVNNSALTGVPTANQSPSFGGNFTVSQPSVNTDGHVTALTSRTITLPSLPSTMPPSSHTQASSTITDMTTVQVLVTYTDETTETLTLFKQTSS